jgi:glycosyltransferase 2 family protein
VPAVLRIARGTATVAVLAALGLALATRWDEVRGQLAHISPQAVAGALAYALLALPAGMLAWRALLADLGSPLPVGTATRVLFLGRLATYRPGSSVRTVVAQTGPARDLGVPRRRAAAAALVLNLVTFWVGVLVALLALPRLLPDDAPGWLHWSPVLVPVGLAGLTPPVLAWGCDRLFRVLRRPPPDVRFSWTGIGVAVLALLGTWLAYGLQVTLLGWSLGADPAGLLLPATGAFAAAWCAGFLVVVVPAGAGIREAVLTVALAAQLPGGSAAALTIAVISRLLLTVADIVAALLGAALGRRADGPAPRGRTGSGKGAARSRGEPAPPSRRTQPVRSRK